MNNLKYKCLKCGVCCFEIPGDYQKRIPLYPEEVENLIVIAKERNIKFQVIEDLVFPDILNKKIIVITYKIKLDNENKCCPFYSEEKGCTIQEIKPMACKAYPLSLKQEDAFHFQISIDPLCNYVLKFYDELTNINLNQIKAIFDEEYKNAELHLKKNKKLILKIKQLEHLNKIKILREITIDQFNDYLKKWDRVEIKV